MDILDRYTRAVLYASTSDGIATAVIEAVASGANLRWANLRWANLSGADLSGAQGLLPNGLVSLQILGTRDPIIVRAAGHITIGCEHHPLSWWRENYQSVGERNKYTAEQIAEYAAHIEHCAAWMLMHGVDQPGPEGEQ